MNPAPILLILDLDETLIHARRQPLERDADFMLFHYHVYRRPGLENFLRRVAEHFTLAVWSSSSDDYMAAVVKEIFPPDIPLAFAWGRSRCTYIFDPNYIDEVHPNDYAQHYLYAKKLNKLRRRGYRLERVLIVDDTPAKCRHNFGNAIYVNEFTGAMDDRELELLLPYLLSLRDQPNMRAIEKRGWKTHTL